MIAAAAAAKADARRLHADAWPPAARMAMNADHLQKLPYDPAKDLVPVALVAGVPFVLVVNADLPVQSVADLVKLAKEKPGCSLRLRRRRRVPSSNTELFSSMTGIKMTARSLQGQRAGHDRPGRRPHPRAVHRHRPCDRSWSGPARRGRSASPAPSARRPRRRFRRSPKLGLPGFDTAAWQMLVAPGQHAEANSCQAQCRGERDRADRRGQSSCSSKLGLDADRQRIGSKSSAPT